MTAVGGGHCAGPVVAVPVDFFGGGTLICETVQLVIWGHCAVPVVAMPISCLDISDLLLL